MPEPASSFSTPTDKASLEHGADFTPRFNSDRLIPAIVTDLDSGDVLMFAWMNADALARTLSTGIGHFWSRSRAKLWQKGEESGNVLKVREIRTDCDQDVIWLRVTVAGDGRACHTGETSCFYRQVVADPSKPTMASLAPIPDSQHAKVCNEPDHVDTKI